MSVLAIRFVVCLNHDEYKRLGYSEGGGYRFVYDVGCLEALHSVSGEVVIYFVGRWEDRVDIEQILELVQKRGFAIGYR